MVSVNGVSAHCLTTFPVSPKQKWLENIYINCGQRRSHFLAIPPPPLPPEFGHYAQMGPAHQPKSGLLEWRLLARVMGRISFKQKNLTFSSNFAVFCRIQHKAKEKAGFTQCPKTAISSPRPTTRTGTTSNPFAP